MVDDKRKLVNKNGICTPGTDHQQLEISSVVCTSVGYRVSVVLGGPCESFCHGCGA